MFLVFFDMSMPATIKLNLYHVNVVYYIFYLLAIEGAVTGLLDEAKEIIPFII